MKNPSHLLRHPSFSFTRRLKLSVRMTARAFVPVAQDDFVPVAGFDRERDLAVFDGDHLRAALNRLGCSPHFVNSAS